MYLNTKSGLSDALDAIGAAVATNQRNDAEMSGLARAGIAGLGPADAPKGLFDSIIGRFVPSAAPAAPVPATPAQPAVALASTPALGVPQNDIASYIGKAAQSRGIDPMTAIRVAVSEGGLAPNRSGDGNSSFGPFQLHYGGVASGGNAVPGLGDDFTKATGLDARDPKNWQKTIDFALDHAAKNGWGAFHGAAKAGLDAYAGITRGAEAAPGQQAISAATGAPPAQPDASQTASPAQSGLPNQAQIQELLRNPATRQLGLQLWQQSITPKDGFTLKPGETHYDARGRQIAAMPAAPMAVREGGAVFDPSTGKPLFSNPKPDSFQHVELNGRGMSFDPRTGQYADTTPANLPQGFRPATADERKQFGVGPTTPFFFGPDGKPATLQGGTQVTVNNAVNPILKGLGEQFVEGAQGARDSADTVRSIQNARTQLQGGIVAGFGADQQLALRKLGSALGFGDPSKIVNTETFMTQMKPIVLSTVKGLGAGSGISNADRDFALQAVGGSIKLEANTIARVLDITERAARAKIDRHNALADQMIAKQPELGQVGPMLRITPPEGAPSAAPQPTQADTSPLGQAKAAIAAGAPRDAVIQRLQKQGIDISGSGL